MAKIMFYYLLCLFAAICKQNRELNDEVLLTRQRAVMSLCDYLHDPEHIAAAIDEGKSSVSQSVGNKIYREKLLR